MSNPSVFDNLSRRLVSVVRYSVLNGRDKFLFVLSDDVTAAEAAALAGALNVSATPLALKRKELVHLATPFPTRSPEFHEAEWARRGEVVYGRDLRHEIPASEWPLSRLQSHLEHVTHRFRSECLEAITSHEPVHNLIHSSMLKLMLSTLLVEGVPQWTAAEIAGRFAEAATPELRAIGAEWERLDRNSPDADFEAVWLHERFVAELQAWIGRRCSGVPERFQCRGDKLVVARDCAGVRAAPAYGLNLPAAGERSGPSREYWDAVDAGMRELSARPEIVSALLYGSLARDEICPGRSDILDAYLVLDDRCFANRAAFLSVFAAMARSCRILEQSNLKFHPFRYVSLNDALYRHPPFYLPEWLSDASSRVLFGKDIRDRLACSAAGIDFAQRTVHTLPAVFRVAAFPANREANRGRELEAARRALSAGAKVLPRWVCAAHGLWVTGSRALGLLPALAGGADISVLNRASEPLARNAGLQQLQPVLGGMLLLMEELIGASGANAGPAAYRA